MAQASTSQVLVSVRPPRPTTISTGTSSSGECSSTVLSFYTGCIITPSCLDGSTTVTAEGDITFNIYGTPELVCTNATITESTASVTSLPPSTTANSVTTSNASMSYTGIASASLQHTPLPTSVSSSTSTSSANPSSSGAGLTATVSAELPCMILLAWVGYLSIRLFSSRHY